MARNVQTPGAAPKTTVDEEVKTTESETTEQQLAEITPENQSQTSDAEPETEPAVDQAALIEQLKNQLAAAEANNQALKGQLRRTTPAKTTDMANATAEAQTAGTPYLSPKGWTRG